jgi:hypothetical protein
MELQERYGERISIVKGFGPAARVSAAESPFGRIYNSDCGNGGTLSVCVELEQQDASIEMYQETGVIKLLCN